MMLNAFKLNRLILSGAIAVLATSAGKAATIIPINSFDPNTFFTGVTAGIDFDDSSPTQAGFTGIPASNNTTYNVVNNGITFDIVVSNTNVGNQNRDRNNANAGVFISDFEQWFNNDSSTDPSTQVEAAFTLTGLNANTDYQISFFTYNVGSGQSTTNFYEGTSSSDPLITSYTTSGNQNNYATWSPGITFQINSGAGGQISVTAQAPLNGSNQSRLNINGVSVVEVVPEPSSILLFGMAGVGLALRRRR